LILACLCASGIAQTRAAREIPVQQKLALVIGNGAYADNALKNSPNDGRSRGPHSARARL